MSLFTTKVRRIEPQQDISGLSRKRNHQERVLDGVAAWASYYRSNIHRFAMDYLHVHLKLFQIFLLYMMDAGNTTVLITCRGLGKTFISAVFCCIRCILYPGTKICIASGTRGQAINVLEKIMHEIRPNSPELASEIDEKETSLSAMKAQIVFKNGSVIKVVTASDTSRGNRAHILLIDEFRMVKKDTIDTILKKFLAAPRHPSYLDKAEYKHLKEPNKTLYLSSAYYQDHWSYTRTKDSFRFMLDENRKEFCCGLPWQLSVAEDLIMPESIEEQMTESDFNEIKWTMEMDALFYGGGEDTFFQYDVVAKNRRVLHTMLPDNLSAMLPASTKTRIQPKQPGEKRLLSADIALMASTRHRNDATAIFINQMIPTKAQRYSNNIVYTENSEGMLTEEQALRIRKLFEMYDCDYIVLDCKGVGLGVFDALVRDITDPETGEIYPALSCCNNQDLADRCAEKNARKAIWAIQGSAKLNSDIALALREGFRTGRVRLLATEIDAEEMFAAVKGYNTLTASDKLTLTLPYIHTTLLINELINLRHEETSGLIRLSEKSGMRKDRYSSLAYNIWVSTQLEKGIRKRNTVLDETYRDAFIFRAPKQNTKKGR